MSQIRLPWNSLYRLVWLYICGNSPGSASKVLGLQVCPAVPGYLCCILFFLFDFHLCLMVGLAHFS